MIDYNEKNLKQWIRSNKLKLENIIMLRININEILMNTIKACWNLRHLIEKRLRSQWTMLERQNFDMFRHNCILFNQKQWFSRKKKPNTFKCRDALSDFSIKWIFLMTSLFPLTDLILIKESCNRCSRFQWHSHSPEEYPSCFTPSGPWPYSGLWISRKNRAVLAVQHKAELLQGLVL